MKRTYGDNRAHLNCGTCSLGEVESALDESGCCTLTTDRRGAIRNARHSSTRTLLLCGLGLLVVFQRPATAVLASDEVRQAGNPADSLQTRFDFYEVAFTTQGKGEYSYRTHWSLRIGTGDPVSPDVARAFDGDAFKLMRYDAHVRHADGSEEEYDEGDLREVSTSRSNEISTSSLQKLTLRRSLKPGDRLEVSTLHEYELGGLGMHFSLNEMAYPADRVICRIEFPTGKPLPLTVTDTTTSPVVSGGPDLGWYSVEWKDWDPSRRKSGDGVIHPIADVLVPDVSIIPKRSPRAPTWRDFGDWYLDLIKERVEVSKDVAALAKSITQNKTTDRAKMDAIFEYCQNTIRYSQVYVELGGFIPNPPETILERRYGDCKDYSLIMYVLARGIGLQPDLALCYRGRGVAVREDAPVSQFNHMILHFEDGDSCLWYDGTNRVGLPGIATLDLAQATALVLKPGDSRLERLRDVSSNILQIRGCLSAQRHEMQGTLNIALRDQYAIDFFWLDFQLNKRSMREYLLDWLRSNLAERIVVDSIHWRTEERTFVIDLDCRLPQSVLAVPPVTYLNGESLFGGLVAKLAPDVSAAGSFYYPGYSVVSVDIELINLRSEPGGSERPHFQASLNIPGGPFTAADGQLFKERMANVRALWTAHRKYYRED